MAEEKPTINVKPMDTSVFQTSSSRAASFISDHRILFMSLIGVILLGVLGWGLYHQQQLKQDKVLAEIVVQFTNTELNKLRVKQLPPADFTKGLQALASRTGKFNGLLPLILESTDVLIEQGANKESLEILQLGEKLFAKENPYNNYFLTIRLAAVYEDLGQLQLAVGLLEKLNSSKVPLLESKVSLDLGRLYMKIGDKDKAQSYLRKVIDNFSIAELARIARIYLEELNQKK
ncbi:MAG: tetratricopeptide repeat protein [Pseudomonadota bacterium]